MPSFYETPRKGDKSRFQRLVDLIPIEAQVCALASILLIAAFLAGPSWASSSGPPNLLVNASYGLTSSHTSSVLECSGATSCGPSESAAAGWELSGLDGGTPPLGATTDRVASTLGLGGRWMLHVTGDGGAGIEQSGTFSVIAARWSVWVLPVTAEVKACVENVGHTPHDAFSCADTEKLGSWQELSGSYDGGPEHVAADRFSIEGIATHMSEPTSYTDFYVAGASLNQV